MAYFTVSSDIKASLAKNLEYQTAAQTRIKESNALAEAILRRKHAAEEAKITKSHAKIEAELSNHSEAHQIKVKDENAAYLSEVVAIHENDWASMRQIDQAYENHADGVLEAYSDYASKVEELLERNKTEGKQWTTDVEFTGKLQELNTVVNDKLIEHNSILKEAKRVAYAYIPGISPALRPRLVKGRTRSTITRNKTSVDEGSLQKANDTDGSASPRIIPKLWRASVGGLATKIYEQKIIILDPHQAATLNERVREIQDKREYENLRFIK